MRPYVRIYFQHRHHITSNIFAIGLQLNELQVPIFSFLNQGILPIFLRSYARVEMNKLWKITVKTRGESLTEFSKNWFLLDWFLYKVKHPRFSWLAALPLTACHSPLAVHCSPLAARHLPLTAHCSRASLTSF